MKKQFYILISTISLICLIVYGFTCSTTTKADVIISKEMAFVGGFKNAYNNDSSKIDDKSISLDSDLLKINAELEALENDVKLLQEEAHASYYHDKFNGKKTANGNIFSNNKYTAAHKTLPFGTKVRVTNLKNNKHVIVEVNDRGPFVKGRHIDLSKKAFMEIAANGNHGSLNVMLEVLPNDYEEKKIELEDELNIIASIPQNLDLSEFSL